MLKLFSLAVSLVLAQANLFAQTRTQNFELTVPEKKISNSLYNKIRLIDARHDTSSVGIIQRGLLNEKVKLLPKSPLAQQLTDILSAMIDSSAGSGELLLQVRQFNLAEITGSFSETGYCYLRAGLFSHVNGNYQVLDRIDSVIVVKKGTDVTNSLLKKGSQVLTGFISRNLLNAPSNATLYSYHDVLHIDSIEKINLPVYQASSFTDGAYKSFNSFVNQTPEHPVEAKIKNGKLAGVKLVMEKGKPQVPVAKSLYAVVFNGLPYISTEYGYYRLTRADGDFYFIGKAKSTANSGEVMVASMLFGVIGGLIASSADATFEMKIDHINGGFIRLQEIRKN